MGEEEGKEVNEKREDAVEGDAIEEDSHDGEDDFNGIVDEDEWQVEAQKVREKEADALESAEMKTLPNTIAAEKPVNEHQSTLTSMDGDLHQTVRVKENDDIDQDQSAGISSMDATDSVVVVS